VDVVGTLDYDYEVEAEDECAAGSKAEEMFRREFSQPMWSAIDYHHVEEIEDD
jgi:hypothetical protein